jgi:exodeoxyribonuclease VII small subunit
VTPPKRAAAKTPSFGEAVEEVERILARLEAEEIDIDDLATEVKRAVSLIKLCREKLAKTDGQVRSLVAELESDADAAATAAAIDTGKPAAPADRGDDQDVPF